MVHYYYVLNYIDWCGNDCLRDGIIEVNAHPETLEEIELLKRRIMGDKLRPHTKSKPLYFKVLSRL